MKSILRVSVSVFSIFIGKNDLRHAYRKVFDSSIDLHSNRAKLAYIAMLTLFRSGYLIPIRDFYLARRATSRIEVPSGSVYDHSYLNLRLNRIYDLPEVVIDQDRPPTINVMVPAFDFGSISAGFFGVFQFSRFLRKTGFNVRLVLFDNFYFDKEKFSKKFADYPGMENILDELEVEYIGERKQPLKVSKIDVSVATVWYSAYFAEKVNRVVGRSRFIYLIQDYEANFFPGGSQFTLADLTYKMDYAAVFSSESLQSYFFENDIGGIKSRFIEYIYFDNACSAYLPSKDEFFGINEAKYKKTLAFYSRPIVDRNMFELTALALTTFYRSGKLRPEEWDCVGMGLGDGVIELLPGLNSIHLPRMSLKEYIDRVSGFDVCLTLMASPHPSMIPMDLAASGSLVVTNTFKTKDRKYLKGLSDNIIAAEPNLSDLVEALAVAVDRSKNIDLRYQNAKKMKFPRDWEQSFGPNHLKFINSVIN